ncbi:MAG: hypothetical protein ACLQO6_02530 [Desulfomonilaceae bacterium]
MNKEIPHPFWIDEIRFMECFSALSYGIWCRKSLSGQDQVIDTNFSKFIYKDDHLLSYGGILPKVTEKVVVPTPRKPYTT